MAAQTMTHGTHTGWFSSFAFHLASYLHIVAAAFGVTVLLNATPILLIVLKIIGGDYLLWMGYRLLVCAKTDAAAIQIFEKQSFRRAFRDSLIVEILNPKSALFYFAFLPQFTTAEAAFPIFWQILALGFIANIAFSFTDIVCIVFAHLVAMQVKASARFETWGRRIGGTILILMGALIIADTGS